MVFCSLAVVTMVGVVVFAECLAALCAGSACVPQNLTRAFVAQAVWARQVD
jgi:hypothetical protein